MKHTPGPWVIDDVSNARYDDYPRDVVTSKGAFLVARCSTIVDAKETEANARLIASAPDMYAALHAVAALYRDWKDHKEDDDRDPVGYLHDAARFASTVLAEAEGRE
jgi:hypothetical protein